MPTNLRGVDEKDVKKAFERNGFAIISYLVMVVSMAMKVLFYEYNELLQICFTLAPSRCNWAPSRSTIRSLESLTSFGAWEILSMSSNLAREHSRYFPMIPTTTDGKLIQ
jgi:hypothetical protein